jgi:hypothetical protein
MAAKKKKRAAKKKKPAVSNCTVDMKAGWAKEGPPGFKLNNPEQSGNVLSEGPIKFKRPVQASLKPSNAPFDFSYTTNQRDATPDESYTEGGNIRSFVSCGARIPERIKEGGCGVQLDWKHGKALLRLCEGLGKSHTIEVQDPGQAQKLANEACAVFIRDKSYAAFLKGRKATKQTPRKKKPKGLKGPSSDCPYGKYKSGPRKGQCRLTPVRGSKSQARRAR